MKVKLLALIALIATASITIIFSCKKKTDDTQNTTTTTPTASSSNWAGSWKTTDQCPTSSTYTLTITASGSSLTLKGLFHGCFLSVSATASGNNFTIPSQTFNSSSQSICGYPYTVSGSGSISGSSLNALSFSFTVKDSSGNTTSCTSSSTKL
ncbi:MAG: hypothetical protein HY063_06760 [Bacteroidetes bacterium]|nr:hypothetical protein [Bacteroidota bacterium]